jgi:ribonuclease HI
MDFSYQMIQSETIYKNLVKSILRRKYLPASLAIKLINTVASSTIAYRMNVLLFDKKWLWSLNDWTCKELAHFNRINSKSDNYFWILVRNLNNLYNLNIKRFISAQVFRILYRQDCISYNSTINKINWDDYSDIDFSFENYNITPPIESVLHSLGLKIFHPDTPFRPPTDFNDEIIEQNLFPKNIIRTLKRKNIFHWEDICTHNLLKSDQELNKLGFSFNYLLSNKWIQLKEQIFPLGLLKNSFQYNTNKLIIPSLTSNTNDNKIEVWTDGSRTIVDNIKIATSAVWFGLNNPNNIVFRTKGTQSSFLAELQALEYALQCLNTNLIIYSDCKSLIKTIDKIKHWPDFKILTLKYGFHLLRIIKMIKSRLNNNKTVNIIHVYSHILEKNHNNKTIKERFQKMKKIFGTDVYRILYGNQQADLLTHEKTTGSPYLPIQNYNLPLLICDNHNYIIDANLKQVINTILTEIDLKKWKDKSPNRTSILFHPSIDFNNSV